MVQSLVAVYRRPWSPWDAEPPTSDVMIMPSDGDITPPSGDCIQTALRDAATMRRCGNVALAGSLPCVPRVYIIQRRLAASTSLTPLVFVATSRPTTFTMPRISRKKTTPAVESVDMFDSQPETLDIHDTPPEEQLGQDLMADGDDEMEDVDEPAPDVPHTPPVITEEEEAQAGIRPGRRQLAIKLILTEEQEVDLGAWYREQPILYDKGLREYKDVNLKAQLLEEKARSLNPPITG